MGRLQREAFWRHAGGYLKNARNVLDIGCGTGEDAARLTRAGIRVTAIDISPQMVAMARKRAVDARVLAIERLDVLEQVFRKCFVRCSDLQFWRAELRERLENIREPLARLVAPGGYAILCGLEGFVFGRARGFCSAAICGKRGAGGEARL